MSAPSGDRERHKADFALLATTIRPSDNFTDLTRVTGITSPPASKLSAAPW